MRLIAPILATGFAFVAAPAFGQEAQCFQNESYLVIAQERVDEVGADFLVREPALGKIKCAFTEQSGDLRIGEPGNPLHYTGLAGYYLVLSRSTGPDGDVVIYDLRNIASGPLVDVPADDDVTIAPQEITFWERTGEANADNCPRFAEYKGYGFGAVIAEERVLDVADGEVVQTGQMRCSSTQ